MIIRFNPLQFLKLFTPLFVLIAISLIVNFQSWQNAPAWTFWVFGIVAIFIVCGCVIMPQRYFLKLQPEGLTIQYLTHQKLYKWQEISHFRVVNLKMNYLPIGELIAFNLTPDSVHRTKLVQLANTSRKLQMLRKDGYDISILAMFKLNTNELLQTLNEWQERYGNSV